MSRRTERIGSLIRDILANLIQSRLNDPRIERFTSITRVDVSPDLSVATVHVTVMAPETRRALTLAALQSAASRLRGFLADELVMRKLPRLVFRIDDSVRTAAEMVNHLDQLRQERGEKPDWEVEAEEAAEELERESADLREDREDA